MIMLEKVSRDPFGARLSLEREPETDRVEESPKEGVREDEGQLERGRERGEQERVEQIER